MKHLFLVIFLTFVSLASVNAQVEKVLGDWATVDDKTGNSYSIVHIFKATNGKYYGRIDRMLIPGTENLVCTACEGKYKNVPIVGLVFIQDMEWTGECLTGGRLLDPESGKFYYGKISYSEKTGKLELRGSLDKMGWFGRSQFWKRANQE